MPTWNLTMLLTKTAWKTTRTIKAKTSTETEMTTAATTRTMVVTRMMAMTMTVEMMVVTMAATMAIKRRPERPGGALRRFCRPDHPPSPRDGLRCGERELLGYHR